jgi:hypothetical protein
MQRVPAISTDMYASYQAKVSAGSKPVAHQASIVLTARLRRRGLGSEADPKFEGQDKEHSEVNELAFTVLDEPGHFAEPEYFTAVNEVNNTLRTDNPKSDEAKLVACWAKYGFLGIVQTPGSLKGISPNEGSYMGNSTNVIHAGGTMTTMNHGPDYIKCNDSVAWYFPETYKGDLTPECWKTKAGGKSRLRAGVFVVKPGSDEYRKAKYHGAIIGRAINSAPPGGQLDLILDV